MNSVGRPVNSLSVSLMYLRPAQTRWCQGFVRGQCEYGRPHMMRSAYVLPLVHIFQPNRFQRMQWPAGVLRSLLRRSAYLFWSCLSMHLFLCGKINREYLTAVYRHILQAHCGFARAACKLTCAKFGRMARQHDSVAAADEAAEGRCMPQDVQESC